MRARPLLLATLLLLPAGALLGARARADLHEDRERNYELELPAGWSRLPADPAWGEAGIVFGAVRALERLKGGEAAHGEGGLLHLAFGDAPEGRDLPALAADASVRAFLMRRFGDAPEAWPAVEVHHTTDAENGLSFAVLVANGEAPNLKARKGPVRAVMVMTIAKRKLYKLRLYAWHSAFDAEGLKDDLDLLELGFAILDATPDPTAQGPRPPAGDEEPVAAPEGDEQEEKVFEDLQAGWRLRKPKGLRSHAWDRKAQPDAVAWFEASEHVGSYQVILYVIPRGRQRDGQQVPDQILKDWGLAPWWVPFSKDHEDGPILTYGFPKRSRKLLDLPDFERERVVFAEVDDRPEEIKPSDMIKKHRFAEDVKGCKMGEEKTIESYRGVLVGNRARFGRETVIRYLWGTPRLTCMVIVCFTKDAHKKWADEVQALLDSVEMTGRPR